MWKKVECLYLLTTTFVSLEMSESEQADFEITLSSETSFPTGRFMSSIYV